MLQKKLAKQWKLRRSAKLFSEFIAEQVEDLRPSQSRRSSRRTQRDFLEQENLGNKSALIVFLIPSEDRVTGGRLQIFSLHRLSKGIFHDTETSVQMCWVPGEGKDRCRVSSHKNDVTVCDFWDVISRAPANCELLLHLPEYAAQDLVQDQIGLDWLTRRSRQSRVRINILNQNIDSMVNRRFIALLQNRGCDVTITAAPSHWASPQEQERMGTPIHWLPTWYYADEAKWQPYGSKQNLLIASPDPCPHRDAVLGAIGAEMPELEIRIIRSIPFEEYTELERNAKWSISFGEGCDGYFYGPAMRGGISFAVHNETFTGWDVEDWQTLYSSYQEMAKHIVSDMRDLEDATKYERYSKRLRERFSKYRSLKALEDQLELFYQECYRLHPIHSNNDSQTAGYH